MTTNWRYLATPTRRRLRETRRVQVSNMTKRIKKLTKQINGILSTSTNCVQDEEIHQDMQSVISKYND